MTRDERQRVDEWIARTPVDELASYVIDDQIVPPRWVLRGFIHDPTKIMIPFPR